MFNLGSAKIPILNAAASGSNPKRMVKRILFVLKQRVCYYPFVRYTFTNFFFFIGGIYNYLYYIIGNRPNNTYKSDKVMVIAFRAFYIVAIGFNGLAAVFVLIFPQDDVNNLNYPILFARLKKAL